MSLPKPNPDAVADGRTTMELGACLPMTAEVRGEHLFVGGVDLAELAREQGTALYVFDEADLRNRMTSYVEAFAANYPKPARVAYASKAFLNKEICRMANELGLCLDVSGGGELACALAAGFPAERIIVHGNNKTPVELEEAISAGVGRIVADSRIELGRISEIAGRLGKVQDVYMRITPGVEADTHEYIRTGCEDSKFGFTMREDFAFTCIKTALEMPNVRLAGLHCHIGSQIFALHSFAEAVDVMVEFIARIKAEYGYAIEELDLGGGLGIAYTVADAPSTIEQFAEMTCNSVKDACERFGVELPEIGVEPGRSIVAVPGMTLYTVGILKTLPGIRNIVAVDGGMSDNIRPALYGSDYEAVVANKADRPRDKVVTLVGKHCESGDYVLADGSIQTPELGDIVCMFGTGAYCSTMSSNYNGQVKPAVVFVRDGAARVVTRRETYEELYARDI